MSDSENRQVLLMQKPEGALGPEHFKLQSTQIPEVADGQVLVKTVLISIDAANRAWMQGATYREAVEAGDVMHGYGLGQVVQSKSEEIEVGSIVLGEVGWQDYAALNSRLVRKATDFRPLSHHLSVFGIAGLTAYHGLIDVGQPKAGDTVLVSAAAGSVGAYVGQIAKLKGCKVIGVAGGADKCRWLVDELGFDDAIDYKSENVFRELKAKAPDGIDIYFDNVGGEILEAALFAMRQHGRVVCCGAVSQYDTAEPAGARGVPGLIVTKRLRMEGFIVLDFIKQIPAAIAELGAWHSAGKLQVNEDIVDGLENAPAALIGLLHGDNRGKRMVRVAPDPE